eukprot:COSAG05_NODE_1514_length_4665_cov_54.657687_3_plen_44_part_00
MGVGMLVVEFDKADRQVEAMQVSSMGQAKYVKITILSGWALRC